MHYDPVTPVGNIFKNIEDLFEYRYMGNCPYSHPRWSPRHTPSLTRPENFESPSSSGIFSFQYRKCGPHSRLILKRPIYNSKIPDNRPFKESVYEQANNVEDIVSRLSTKFQYQVNMVNSAPTEDPAPSIVVTAELLQKVLAQNQ